MPDEDGISNVVTCPDKTRFDPNAANAYHCVAMCRDVSRCVADPEVLLPGQHSAGVALGHAFAAQPAEDTLLSW